MSGALSRSQIVWLTGRMYKNPPLSVSPTNGEVATRLGMSVSGMSRLRSGARMPSIEKMAHIQQAYGWSVDDQMSARASGTWAVEFEKALVGEHSK